MLSLVGTDLFEIAASVPLVLEYEDALMRQLESTDIESPDVVAIVDYLCSVAVHQRVFFLWRPLLRDPQDDHVAEVAIAGGCEMIITFNKRDFQPIKQFGISLATPFEFLQQLGEIP